ncbi:SDR family NAD(P)-dependent oxidoreductase [Bacillus lacus]|uniref:SDR family NAD(P)-dependent oxidoreductase n=1 Tax=Metabacillus lacus TaxID=1983721 RepID=A0A7X2J2T0_9BACI|nr:SDR family oxidoreductase [Metabacillus lacus]MRX74082.1 SDR family NAD(P)-dependent oxidoreductase [Metabacillus lacus]
MQKLDEEILSVQNQVETNKNQQASKAVFTHLHLKKLHEQVVVITGASSGIGLATARMAAARGAKVVAAARNEDALKQLVDELRSKGCQAVYVVADVGIEEDVMEIADTAEREFGGFDTWVNNAAVSIYGNAMDVKIADMRHMFETNFWGVVYGTRIAVKHFKDRGVPGALINIGSLFGDRGTVVQSTYASAKFALHGWTESIRMELEKEKAPVSVTLIHPGRIDTPYNEHAVSYLEKQPAHVGMMYTPEVVAEAILFAAEHPKRDIFVGGQAKFLATFGRLAPRLMDKWIQLTMYRTQHDDRPSKPREESALYDPGYGMHERGTNSGWVRDKSLYVEATKRPVATALALAGIGASIWAMARGKNK